MERSPAIEVNNTAPMVVCQDCGLVFSLLSNNLIAVNPTEQIYAISISQSESYCLRCLEQTVKGEMREIRLLEERYIYQMEFESYSET